MKSLIRCLNSFVFSRNSSLDRSLIFSQASRVFSTIGWISLTSLSDLLPSSFFNMVNIFFVFLLSQQLIQ